MTLDEMYLRMPWRVGRKVGRTIYAQGTSEPRDDDLLIGLMDSVALAKHVVEAHNLSLAWKTEATRSSVNPRPGDPDATYG